MFLHQLVRENSGCCTCLLGSDESKEFLIVDPLMDVERFLEIVNTAGGRLVAIIETHVHADHLSGAREIQRMVGCPIYMYASSRVLFNFSPLTEGELEIGGIKITVLHTPGHAPEHVCLLMNGASLLTGDCLLVRDVGRTDLGRGSPDELYTSLFSKLMRLEDRVEVLPAHVGKQHFVSGETSSTIGIERRLNPALQVKSQPEFHEYMTVGWPPKPPCHELFVQVNSGELDLTAAQELAKVAQGELYSD